DVAPHGKFFEFGNETHDGLLPEAIAVRAPVNAPSLTVKQTPNYRPRHRSHRPAGQPAPVNIRLQLSSCAFASSELRPGQLRRPPPPPPPCLSPWLRSWRGACASSCRAQALPQPPLPPLPRAASTPSAQSRLGAASSAGCGCSRPDAP